MKNILTLVIVCFCIGTKTVHAQQFQWIRGGGSITDGTGLVSKEELRFLTTDSNRNVYAASQVFGQNLKADTFYVPFSNVSQGMGKILLTSYKCDGTMRWAKLLESGGGISYVYGLSYDGGGNIYIAGSMASGSKYFGNDTVVTSQNLRNFLLKLDTSGNFNWVRFVGADAFQTQMNTGVVGALAVDGIGDIHHYLYLNNGVQLTPTVTSIRGTYDVRYSSSGNLLSVTRLGIDSTGIIWNRVTLNKASGTIYAQVEPNQSFPSSQQHPYCLVAIAPNGNVLWRDTFAAYSAVGALYYDGAGNLYGAGAGGGGGNPFGIKNQQVFNTAYPNGQLGVVVRLDTMGNVKWIYKNQGNTAIVYLMAIAPLPGNRIIATGTAGGKIKTGSGVDSLVTPQGQGQNPYYTIIDTSGTFMQFGQLHGNGFYDNSLVTVADKQGNIIMGGQVEDSLKASNPGVTPYKTNGGTSDFYLAKYGFGCNCTVAPTASYTKTVNNATKTATFTYTGTTTGLDSLVWQWGDGQKLKVTTNYSAPVTHTYATVGTYNATVTAYSGCGTNTATQALQFTTGLGSMEAFARAMIYPNPATDVLVIESVERGTVYSLFSVVGQRVQTGVVNSGKHAISLHDLPFGTYMLVLNGKDGTRGTVHITKL